MSDTLAVHHRLLPEPENMVFVPELKQTWGGSFGVSVSDTSCGEGIRPLSSSEVNESDHKQVVLMEGQADPADPSLLHIQCELC